MHIWQHRPRIAGEEFLRPVPEIAFPQTGDGRVDGDEERGRTGLHGALEASRGDVTAADLVELIPERTFGAGAHFVDAAAGQCRERVCRARFAGGSSGDNFAARVEHPAAADRRQRKRKRKVVAEDPRAQVNRRRDRGPRPKQYVFEDSTVLAQRDFAIGATVDVVERDSRQPAFGQASEVGNVEDARRIDSVSHGSGSREEEL